jgi:broad-specificity NMP kinase
MKILITGFPGTGKSSIARELKRRGHIAYDPETMHSFMHLEDVQTGKHIRMPEQPRRGWFDTVGSFNWDIPKVLTLLNSSGDDVFICSLADNMNTILTEFDKVFVLTLDDFTLEQRLRHRENDLSKIPEQLADILTLHKHFEESMAAKKAIVINVSSDIIAVTDHILDLTYGAK